MAYDLDRFKKAQAEDYATALEEIKRGRKESHWIWYIFPQLKELGFSSTAKYYGIDGLDEAKAYMADAELRRNLLKITDALLRQPETDIHRVMGYPDDLKLRSSMTLFEAAAPDCSVFGEVLDRFYSGERDDATLKRLA